MDKVFHDSVSGGGDFMKRPAMVCLLEYLEKHSYTDYVVVFDDLKRFARDTVFHWKLRNELGVRGARPECLNFKFEDTPEGEFIETIIAAQGQLERQQNSRQVIQKQKARLERGYWPFGAISGFVQINHVEHGKLLAPKEPNAGIIKEALEGFASGRFDTRTDVATFLKKVDYAKYPTIETVNRLIEKTAIYAGFIEYPKWEVERRSGYHQSIITPATHFKIKEKLEGKTRTHERKILNEDFPLRGFVECSDCSKPMTASWSTSRGNKFGYYRCKTKGCASVGKSIGKDKIEAEFLGILGKIKPSKHVMSLTREILKDVWLNKKSAVESKRSEMSIELSAIKKEREALLVRIPKAYDESVVHVYESRLSELSKREVFLKDSAMSFDACKPNIGTAMDIVFDFLENPMTQWQKGDIHTRKLVLKLVFEEKLTYNKNSGFETAVLSLPLRVFSLPEAQNSSLVEMAGVVLTVTNSLTLISAAGHGSTVLRLRKRHKTCLRRSTPDESKTVCFLHLHKQKSPTQSVG